MEIKHVGSDQALLLSGLSFLICKMVSHKLIEKSISDKTFPMSGKVPSTLSAQAGFLS